MPRCPKCGHTHGKRWLDLGLIGSLVLAVIIFLVCLTYFFASLIVSKSSALRVAPDQEERDGNQRNRK